jgi:hypothetical protein
MSLVLDTPARPSLGSRILHATPVLGTLARDIARDVNTIFYVLTILVTLLVLAIQTWGFAALVLSADAVLAVEHEQSPSVLVDPFSGSSNNTMLIAASNA